jgi:hypothetical protein
VDIDLAPESRNLRGSRADLEHLAERGAPMDQQRCWRAIFGLEAQSTQTRRRRTPHPIILRSFQPGRKRSMNAAETIRVRLGRMRRLRFRD